ncbi:phage portal protein [Sinirhodobacter huangdaonensis]|uniref:Phage portal protein n=1 Tax=Paenirhodobacter huangdaonensis TaxID=2501515 RepID=A0A443LFW0_9RHOB|nr:phage portal protein [Sinirhodobacter huangdaonensis]RWR48023.1 phage portal protein [Sinirhodobacter huangdaonensis]
MAFLFNIIERLFKRSGIEAGGGGDRWKGVATLTAPQQQTLAARMASKGRAAALYLNTALGNRIVECLASALVGKGWQARPQHPDPVERRALSEAFEALTRPIMQPIARAIVRDGEAFVQLVVGEGGTFRPKLLASDQIDPSLTRDLGDGARIVAGVEFDAADQVVAYHVLRDAPGTPFATYSAPVRVPAQDMLHIFDTLFPGQVRGLSWLTPVLLKLRDRDEASDAMLMQLKVASLITGFIRDPEGGAAGFAAEDGTMNVALEPGAMRILPVGADVTFSQPGQGLAQAIEFLRAQDREIAAGVGLTFEALTGDLGEANYSSARVGMLEFRRRAEAMQQNLIEAQFLRPLWKRWTDVRALTGELPANPASLADYHAVRFVAPGWAWVDPQNEVTADVAAIAAGLKSREEVVAGRGRDIDELDEERARDAMRPQTAEVPA